MINCYKMDKSSWQIKQPLPGNHLLTKIDNIYHHGVFTANDTVIHYSSENGFQLLYPYKMKIVETSTDTFRQGGDIWVKIYTPEESKYLRSTEEILKRAAERLGESEYDLIYNNCEHFAYDCTLGIYKSELVDYLRNFRENKKPRNNYLMFLSEISRQLRIKGV